MSILRGTVQHESRARGSRRPAEPSPPVDRSRTEVPFRPERLARHAPPREQPEALLSAVKPHFVVEPEVRRFVLRGSSRLVRSHASNRQIEGADQEIGSWLFNRQAKVG